MCWSARLIALELRPGDHRAGGRRAPVRDGALLRRRVPAAAAVRGGGRGLRGPLRARARGLPARRPECCARYDDLIRRERGLRRAQPSGPARWFGARLGRADDDASALRERGRGHRVPWRPRGRRGPRTRRGRASTGTRSSPAHLHRTWCQRDARRHRAGHAHRPGRQSLHLHRNGIRRTLGADRGHAARLYGAQSRIWCADRA